MNGEFVVDAFDLAWLFVVGDGFQKGSIQVQDDERRIFWSARQHQQTLADLSLSLTKRWKSRKTERKKERQSTS